MKNAMLSVCLMISCRSAYADSLDPESLPPEPRLTSTENAANTKSEIAANQLLGAHARSLQWNWTKQNILLLDHDLLEDIASPMVISSGLNVLFARDFSGKQIGNITIVTEKEKKKQDEEAEERKRNKGGHREP